MMKHFYYTAPRVRVFSEALEDAFLKSGTGSGENLGDPYRDDDDYEDLFN